MQRPKNPILNVLRIVGGILLLIIGLAALITPLTPGAWLAIVGLEMLGWGFIIPERIRKLWRKPKAGDQNTEDRTRNAE